MLSREPLNYADRFPYRRIFSFPFLSPPCVLDLRFFRFPYFDFIGHVKFKHTPHTLCVHLIDRMEENRYSAVRFLSHDIRFPRRRLVTQNFRKRFSNSSKKKNRLLRVRFRRHGDRVRVSQTFERPTEPSVRVEKVNTRRSDESASPN